MFQRAEEERERESEGERKTSRLLSSRENRADALASGKGKQSFSSAYPPLRVKKYFSGTAGRPSTCKIISRRDSLEMGELCCLEFYVSTRPHHLLPSSPPVAVRAHSFELLGRHKARKKRDRGFVWSGNKRRCRDRP